MDKVRKTFEVLVEKNFDCLVVTVSRNISIKVILLRI